MVIQLQSFPTPQKCDTEGENAVCSHFFAVKELILEDSSTYMLKCKVLTEIHFKCEEVLECTLKIEDEVNFSQLQSAEEILKYPLLS